MIEVFGSESDGLSFEETVSVFRVEWEVLMPACSRIILPHRHVPSVSLACQTDEIWWPDGNIVGYSIQGGTPFIISGSAGRYTVHTEYRCLFFLIIQLIRYRSKLSVFFCFFLPLSLYPPFSFFLSLSSPSLLTFPTTFFYLFFYFLFIL